MDNSTFENALLNHRIMKIFGFSPKTIVNGKSVTKPLDFVAPTINLIIGSLLVYFSIQNPEELSQSKSEIINFGNFVTFIAGIIISIICVIVSFFFRHHTWEVFIELSKIEKNFARIGFPVSYEFKTKVITRMVYVPLCLIPFFCYTSYLVNGSILIAFIYAYAGSCFLLNGALDIVILNLSFERLKSFRGIFESMAKYPSDIIIVRKKDHKNDVEIIGTLIATYNIFVDICNLTNLSDGAKIMFSFGVVYFYSLFVSFMAFKSFINDGFLDNVAISGLTFSTVLVIFMIVMVFACISIENETKKILKISNSMLKRTKDERKIELLMSLNSIVSRNPLKRSCGFFDLDWSLIFSVSLF